MEKIQIEKKNISESYFFKNVTTTYLNNTVNKLAYIFSSTFIYLFIFLSTTDFTEEIFLLSLRLLYFSLLHVDTLPTKTNPAGIIRLSCQQNRQFSTEFSKDDTIEEKELFFNQTLEIDILIDSHVLKFLLKSS